MTYFRLLDTENMNTIVRAEGRSQQQFVKEKGWVETGIMIDYFCDESDVYNMYEEISEDQVLKITA